MTSEQASALTDEFGKGWSIPDRDARHARLAPLLSTDLLYLDPHQDRRVEGRDTYLALSDQLHALLPELTLRCGDVVQHHNVLRFGSILLCNDGELVVKGQFFALLDDEDRIGVLAAFGAP